MSARWLVHLYPREWRARYGAELEDLIDAGPFSPALVVDVLLGAFDAHTHPRLSPQAATQRGSLMLPTLLRCRPTPGMLVAMALYVAVMTVLGLARRT